MTQVKPTILVWIAAVTAITPILGGNLPWPYSSVSMPDRHILFALVSLVAASVAFFQSPSDWQKVALVLASMAAFLPLIFYAFIAFIWSRPGGFAP